MKGVNHVASFQDFQHAALMRQLLACAVKSDKSGCYRFDVNVTARQLDQIAEIGNIFERLHGAQTMPAERKDPGGD